MNDFLSEMRDRHEAYGREHEAWVRTPLPPYFHSCRRHVKRSGVVNGTFVQRCACGGINVMGGWVNKNESRAFHKEERKRLGL